MKRGDGEEACGGGVGEGAGPLVYADGAGGWGGGGGAVGLGVEGCDAEGGESEEAADEGPEVHLAMVDEGVRRTRCGADY